MRDLAIMARRILRTMRGALQTKLLKGNKFNSGLLAAKK